MADNRIAFLKQANKLFRQGKIDAAIKEYKKVLAIKPDDPEVRRIIGDLEIQNNNIPGAIEQFEWIGDYYLRDGFFAKAIAMYKRITRLDPAFERILFKLADLYNKQGLVMEAKQIYLDIAEECKRQNNQKKALDMYKRILEFDKSNIKMRLLLADNYLKEGLEEQAISEYLAAADILWSKKEIRRVEELLLSTIKNVKNIKVIEKLIYFYTKQEEDDKAIHILEDLGLEVFKNVDLLKILGELYLKKNLMSEAENIFSKIVEIDPEETEVIMRLGKVYMQRNEYDKTFNLFLPIIDKNIAGKKYEEAAALLRFIIASNNTYLKALLKLASIFKISGKTNNLIALYESMIPIFESKGMTEDLEKVLEELIQLSDTPFSYEEQLARLTGQATKQPEEEESEDQREKEREREFISFNMRLVEEALKISDYNKAQDILKKSKQIFPHNIEIRQKLFDFYQATDRIDLAVEEGKGLLDIYKHQGRSDDYADLLHKLSTLKPEDDKLVSLSVEEKTSIEIDFDKSALEEEISGSEMDEGDVEEADILLLSDEENVTGPQLSIEDESDNISSVLSEVDFYVNDGYFSDAERLINQLKEKYPRNKQLLQKIDKLEKLKRDEQVKKVSGRERNIAAFEIETSFPGEPNLFPPHREHTERIAKKASEQDISGSIVYQTQDSNMEIDIDLGDMEAHSSPSFKLAEESNPSFSHMPMEIDLDQFGTGPGMEAPMTMPPDEDLFDIGASSGKHQFEDSSMLKISEEAYAAPSKHNLEVDIFAIESSIAEESVIAQKHSDSQVDLKIGKITPPPGNKPTPPKKTETQEPAFEIELEVPEDTSAVPIMKIEQDMLIQAPSASPAVKEKGQDGYTSSVIDEFDLDSIMKDEEAPYDLESPFKEMSSPEMLFDMEDDLLKEEGIFVEEAFLETEKIIPEEIEAIAFWLKELEKQRTSTIEKNMMEIFEEFKKGVDEKIGREDFDTRYNLGIAYKEMGLLEEAIHEFLISAKHPSKFFDSAGLLGMCFRDKGLFGEAISWFDKALKTPDRRKEEYLAVKYELVITLKLKEEYRIALKLLEEIIQLAPSYRNVPQLHEEIKSLASR